jgi:RecB family exonuclease
MLEAHPLIGGAVAEAAGRWPEAPMVLPVELPLYHREKASPSSLNDLAQCAFKHFAQRVCQLKELDPPLAAGLDPMKRGTVIHAALEQWTHDNPELDPASLLAAFDATWLELVHEGESALYGPQRAAMTRRLHAFAQVEASGWPWTRVSTEAELSFGKDEPMSLMLPDGRPFTYTGSIDRLDTVTFQGQRCLVLMDYKNSKTTLKSKEQELIDALKALDGEDASEYGAPSSEGSDITLLASDVQLPLYAYAASQLRGLPILAAFHYPLGDPHGRVHGFLPGSGSWKIGDWSAVNPPLVLATSEQWDGLIGLLTARIAELFGRLEARDIHPEPLYQKRCGPGQCSYARLCRYDEMPARSRW